MRDIICQHCQKNFHHYFEEWELHLQMAHNKTPPMQCKECDAVLIGLGEFDRHQEFEHGRKMSSIFLGVKLYARKYAEMFKQ